MSSRKKEVQSRDTRCFGRKKSWRPLTCSVPLRPLHISFCRFESVDESVVEGANAENERD